MGLRIQIAPKEIFEHATAPEQSLLDDFTDV